MAMKSKPAADVKARLQRLSERVENPARIRLSSSSNPPQLSSSLSGYERESREADAKLREAASTKRRTSRSGLS
jgi:hypothetical protein